ncbi:MAG: DUF697 domain-containing protein [Bacteroidetes bacterium]|nr:DUF697 domain-containing protein [Bacteroidota bacterium]
MNDFKDVKNEREKHAETVVRNHVMFSMGAGAIPVPVADVLAVSASQLDMIRQLCKVYDIDFSETQGKAIVSSLTTSTLARMGAKSLLKFVPVVGSVVGGVVNAVMAGASTYALGQVFKSHFSTGGTILDFDAERLKKLYKEQFEKGKKVADELRKQQEAKQKAEEAAGAAATTSEEDFVPDPVATTAIDAEAAADATVLTRLKELGELKAAGIITDAEFEKMKKRILK